VEERNSPQEKQTLIPLLRVPRQMGFSSPVFPSLGQEQKTWGQEELQGVSGWQSDLCCVAGW